MYIGGCMNIINRHEHYYGKYQKDENFGILYYAGWLEFELEETEDRLETANEKIRQYEQLILANKKSGIKCI
jgi:hypothetical protein